MSYHPENINEGRKAIAADNTAVALVASSTKCKQLFITAEVDNTEPVVIGGSAVVYNPTGSRTGKLLYAGDSITIDINDVSKVYINGKANDGVTFTYTS